MDYLHYQNCVTKFLRVQNFTYDKNDMWHIPCIKKKCQHFFLIKEDYSNIWTRNLVLAAN
jgi:hypothetical protein